MLKFIIIVILNVIVEVMLILNLTLSMRARRKRAWRAPWMRGRRVASKVTVTVTSVI